MSYPAQVRSDRLRTAYDAARNRGDTAFTLPSGESIAIEQPIAAPVPPSPSIAGADEDKKRDRRREDDRRSEIRKADADARDRDASIQQRQQAQRVERQRQDVAADARQANAQAHARRVATAEADDDRRRARRRADRNRKPIWVFENTPRPQQIMAALTKIGAALAFLLNRLFNRTRATVVGFVPAISFTASAAPAAYVVPADFRMRDFDEGRPPAPKKRADRQRDAEWEFKKSGMRAKIEFGHEHVFLIVESVLRRGNISLQGDDFATLREVSEDLPFLLQGFLDEDAAARAYRDFEALTDGGMHPRQAAEEMTPKLIAKAKKLGDEARAYCLAHDKPDPYEGFGPGQPRPDFDGDDDSGKGTESVDGNRELEPNRALSLTPDYMQRSY